jgi:hypothetical protein
MTPQKIDETFICLAIGEMANVDHGNRYPAGADEGIRESDADQSTPNKYDPDPTISIPETNRKQPT